MGKEINQTSGLNLKVGPEDKKEITSSTNKKEVFNPLKNQIVEIALILKKPNAIVNTGEDAVLLKGCSIEIIPDVDDNSNIKAVLTKEEQEFLENYLGLLPNDLSVYKKQDNFWINNRNSKLVFTRTGASLESATIKLNLLDPYDFIKYKVALGSRYVSPKWSSRYDNPDWKFSIRRSDDETEELNIKVNKEAIVMAYLLEHKKSKLKLFNLIRLFHTKINKSIKNFSFKQSADFMFNQLWVYTKVNNELDVLYNFITMKDEDRLDEVFLINALGSGAIVQNGAIYRLSSGGIVGYSKQEVIDFFKSKENQQTKLIVTSQIEEFYKE